MSEVIFKGKDIGTWVVIANLISLWTWTCSCMDVSKILDFSSWFHSNLYISIYIRAVDTVAGIRLLYLQLELYLGRQAFGGDGTRYPISPFSALELENGTAPSVDLGGGRLPHGDKGPVFILSLWVSISLFCLIISERLKPRNLPKVASKGAYCC